MKKRDYIITNVTERSCPSRQEFIRKEKQHKKLTNRPFNKANMDKETCEILQESGGENHEDQ